MAEPMNVKSELSLGEQLLCLLRSGEVLHNPLKLLCLDGERIVHRDAMEASSGYFREHLRASGQPEEPLRVPVSGRIIDLIIELIYTTCAVSFEVTDFVELYAATHLFQLSEITSKLARFLGRNISRCLQGDNFFSRQPQENVALTLTLFRVKLSGVDQVGLVRNLNEWSKRCSISRERLMYLVSRVSNLYATSASVRTIKRTRESRMSTGFRFPQTVPLFATDNGFLEVEGGRVMERKNPQRFADLSSFEPVIVKGKEVFARRDRRVDVLDVYDLITGEKMRSIALPSKGWMLQIVERHGRLYGFDMLEVYEVEANSCTKLFTSLDRATELCVLYHVDEIFKFYYSDLNGNASFVVCNTDTCSLKAIRLNPKCRLIGVHRERLYAWTLKREILVIEGTSVIWKRHIENHPSSYISCGPQIYLMSNNCLTVVDTESGNTTSSIVASEGCLIVRLLGN